MAGMKARAKTLKELAELGAFYAAERPLALNDKAAKLLEGEARPLLARLRPRLAALDDWSAEALEAEVRAFAEAEAVKLGAVAQPLRAALTGSNVSPPIFEAAAILGREESLSRLDDRLAER